MTDIKSPHTGRKVYVDSFFPELCLHEHQRFWRQVDHLKRKRMYAAVKPLQAMPVNE